MILLDYRDRRPIYEQIVDRFVELMVTGVMEQDSQMPSVRSMAMELSINPNTIQRAYGELERQGYIYTIKGKGSFVADSGKIRARRAEEMLREFRERAKGARNLGVEEERLHGVIVEVYGEESRRRDLEGTSESPGRRQTHDERCITQTDPGKTGRPLAAGVREEGKTP